MKIALWTVLFVLGLGVVFLLGVYLGQLWRG